MAIRSQIKLLGSDTIVYGIGHLLTKVIAFLLIPIYTRHLAISAVGYYALLETLELLTVSLISSGMQYSLWRFLPKSAQADLKKYIISGFFGTLVLSCILLIIMSLFSGEIADVIGLDISQEYLIKLVFLNIIFSFGFRYFLYYLQFKRKSIKYISVALFQLIGICGLTIWFVVIDNRGLDGLIMAKTITLGLLFIFVLFSLIRETAVWPTVPHYLQMAKYGVPLIPLILVFPILNLADRFFLNSFVSSEEIGIYSVAYRIGMILQMALVVPVQRSWLPMMYKMDIEKSENRDIIRDSLFYFCILGGFVFLGISQMGEFILGIASTDAYLAGAKFIPFILFAYFLNGFRVFFLSGAALKDQNKKLGFISLSGIAVNLVLNWILISKYGTNGAAWATVISFFYLTLVIYILSQKEVFINWKWKRIWKLLFVIFFLFLSLNQLTIHYPNLKVLALILMIPIYPILLIVFNIIGKRELSSVKLLINNIKN